MSMTRREFGRTVGLLAGGAMIRPPSSLFSPAIDAIERDDLRRKVGDTLAEYLIGRTLPHSELGCSIFDLRNEIFHLPQATRSIPALTPIIRELGNPTGTSPCGLCVDTATWIALSIEKDPAAKAVLIERRFATEVRYPPEAILMADAIGAPGRTILERAARQSNGDWTSAVDCLIEQGDRSFLPRVREMLEGPECGHAAHLLRLMDDRASIPRLRELLIPAVDDVVEQVRRGRLGRGKWRYGIVPAHALAQSLLGMGDTWTARHLVDRAEQGTLPPSNVLYMTLGISLPPCALDEALVDFLRRHETLPSRSDRSELVCLLLAQDRRLSPSRMDAWANEIAFSHTTLRILEVTMAPERYRALLAALRRSSGLDNRCLAAWKMWEQGDTSVLPDLRRDVDGIPRDGRRRDWLVDPLAEIPDPAIHAWVKAEIAGHDVVGSRELYAAMAAGGDRESMDILATALVSDRPLVERAQIAGNLCKILF